MIERPTEAEMDIIHSNLIKMKEHLHNRYPHTWMNMFNDFDINYSHYLQQTNYQIIYRFCDGDDCEEALNKISDREFLKEERLENKKEVARMKMCSIQEDFSDDLEEDSFANKLMRM